MIIVLLHVGRMCTKIAHLRQNIVVSHKLIGTNSFYICCVIFLRGIEAYLFLLDFIFESFSD